MTKTTKTKTKYTKAQLTGMLADAVIWRAQLRAEAERVTGLPSVADFSRVVEACRKIVEGVAS